MNITPKRESMKIPRILVAGLMLTSFFISCQTSPKTDAPITKTPNYEYDENRITAIADLCDRALKMLDDPKTPTDKLNNQMSQLFDTLNFTIRHCQAFEFNMWLRGYARHITQPVIMDNRLNDNVKEKIIYTPYEWTIMQTDSSGFAYTTMFRSSGEMNNRFANIILYSKAEIQECTFVITNYTDTIIDDVNIEFYNKDEKVKTLHIYDAELIDSNNAADGVLRIIFPINEFMPIFESAGSVRITFNAKNDQVLFLHIFPPEEQKLIMNLFSVKQ